MSAPVLFKFDADKQHILMPIEGKDYRLLTDADIHLLDRKSRVEKRSRWINSRKGRRR